MKKVGIISLGCAKNRVDSENILGLLQKDNYQLVSSVKESDIVIINTCGFINESKKESIDTIIHTIVQNKTVVVCGCLVERYCEQLKKEIPEVKAWIPLRDYDKFNEILSTVDNDLENKYGGVDDKYRVLSTGPFSAYLKIGDGCSNNCTYCAIPLIRGKYHSRPFNEIIDEAKHLASVGIKEIVILEQDTTKYGIDFYDGTNIVTLLKELLKIKEFEYIRLLYLYPDEISDELIDLIAKEDRLTHYFDIPIQHSEDHILKDMNRRGNKEYLTNLFNKIRTKIPDAIIRTTVMVGFPGETSKDVDNLIEFMNNVSFNHLGAFTYSKEEGTISAHYPKQISEKVKKTRLDKVMRAQQSISYRNNKKLVGTIMEGLVIGKEKGNYLLRSYFNAPDDVDGKIYFTSNVKHYYGDKVKVKITEAFVYDLFGELYEN